MARALGDASRMRVIAALFSSGELCVCQLTALLGFAASTVSRHISLLQEAGLVDSRKEGRWVFYRISDTFPEELRPWIEIAALGTEEARADRKNMAGILALSPEELCGRSQ